MKFSKGNDVMLSHLNPLGVRCAVTPHEAKLSVGLGNE